MNFEVFYNTILSELADKHHKLEMELERLINADMNVMEKAEQIKLTLNDIAVNELAIGKWHHYYPDNNEDKQEDDGQTK